MTKATTKATTSTATEINRTQHRVLVVLAAADGPMTRGQIMDTAFNGNSTNLKPVLEPLTTAKLAIMKKLPVDTGRTDKDGEPIMTDVETFAVTASGRKWAVKPLPTRAGGTGEHEPLPKVGGSFTKDFKDVEYKVTVTADGFAVYGAKGKKLGEYTSLTSAAKAIRDAAGCNPQEVNGWAFFGLVKAAAEDTAAPTPKAKAATKAAPKAKAKGGVAVDADGRVTAK